MGRVMPTLKNAPPARARQESENANSWMKSKMRPLHTGYVADFIATHNQPWRIAMSKHKSNPITQEVVSRIQSVEAVKKGGQVPAGRLSDQERRKPYL